MRLIGEELGQMGTLLGALCDGDDDTMMGSSWLQQCPMSFTATGLAALARGNSVAFRRVCDDEDVVLDSVCDPEDSFDVVTALQVIRRPTYLLRVCWAM